MNLAEIKTLLVKPSNITTMFDYGVNTHETNKLCGYEEIYSLCYELLPARRRQYYDYLHSNISFILIPSEGAIYELTEQVLDINFKDKLLKESLEERQKELNKINKQDVQSFIQKRIEQLAMQTYEE